MLCSLPSVERRDIPRSKLADAGTVNRDDFLDCQASSGLAPPNGPYCGTRSVFSPREACGAYLDVCLAHNDEGKTANQSSASIEL